MLPLATDEDVHEDIVRCLRRREPALDLVRVVDVGLGHTPDPLILEWAAGEERILVTGDLNSMVGFACSRVQAALLDATNPEIFKNRGIAYLNLARFEEALADVRQARELDPDHPEQYDKTLALIYAQRGVANVQAKKWGEALADLDEAIRFDAANAEIYDKRGSLHFNERRFDAARKDFSAAIDLNPHLPAYHLHRGYANQALGRSQEAAVDFKQAEARSASGDVK